jgi:hypothetical protein
MAVPDYTTDLLDFELCAGSANFLPEFVGYAEGRSETQDTDYEIQGAGHVSKQYNATGLGSLGIENPTGPGDPIAGWVSGWNFFMWGVFLPAGAVASYANGGLRMIVGSDASNHRQWIVGGNDFGSYPYGGWQNFVVDPETDGDYTDEGTYTSDYGVVGMGTNVLAAISKGNPFGIDAIRYGRGEIRAVAGSVGDGYADFDGMAAKNDLNANMWGLFQRIPGGYLFKGKMVLGYGALVDFKAANVSIVIDDTRKVLASFNRIEITTAGSTISWTNVSFTSLGTVAKGELEMMDNATHVDVGGVFTDMSTFIYQSNADITGRTYRRCGQVTQGGGDFTGCIFDESVAAVALVADDIDLVTGCTFNSDGAGHAVNLGTIAVTDSVSWNNYESGYAAQGGTAANRTILVNVASGQTLTINVAAGGASTPTYYNTGSGDVSVVAGSVTVQVTVTTTGGVPIEDALVYVQAKDGTGPFPFEDVVTSITNSGTTATVAHTAHGMATGDYVHIYGGTLAANRGVFLITVNGVDEYEYTMLSTPGSSPTGTITSTFVALYGLTNSSGIKSVGRVYTSDQPITGWARKSTSSPFYVEGPISGTIDSADGLPASAVLVLDE